MREYEVVDYDNVTIQFKKAHPMQWGRNTYGNGFWCIPPEQARKLKEEIISYRRAKAQKEQTGQ